METLNIRIIDTGPTSPSRLLHRLADLWRGHEDVLLTTVRVSVERDGRSEGIDTQPIFVYACARCGRMRTWCEQ